MKTCPGAHRPPRLSEVPGGGGGGGASPRQSLKVSKIQRRMSHLPDPTTAHLRQLNAWRLAAPAGLRDGARSSAFAVPPSLLAAGRFPGQTPTKHNSLRVPGQTRETRSTPFVLNQVKAYNAILVLDCAVAACPIWSLAAYRCRVHGLQVEAGVVLQALVPTCPYDGGGNSLCEPSGRRCQELYLFSGPAESSLLQL